MEQLCCSLRAVRLEDDGLVGLRSVHVHMDVCDLVCSMVTKQEFVNDGVLPVEVEYVFPVDSDGVMYSIVANIDGKRIVTEVKEKKKAEQEYNTALKQQKKAVIVRSTKADISVLGLGNLPPHSVCTVELKQLSIAPMESANTGNQQIEGSRQDDPFESITDVKDQFSTSQIRVVIPTVVAPRYDPSQGALNLSVAKSALSSATRIDGKELPYKMTAQFTLQMASDIVKIKSPGKEIIVNNKNGKEATVTFPDALVMDKDIVLLIEVAKPFDSRAHLSWSDEHKSFMLMAAFCLPELTAEQREHTSTEVHYVVDCSGSMSGVSIEMVKKCMRLILKSMDPSQTFNLHRFGSESKTLWRYARPYSDKSLADAERWVDKLSADLGGTELLKPLVNVLERIPAVPGFPRQVVVLTDGEIENTNQVIDLIRRHGHLARVFPIGIGLSVSKHLVNSMARAGGGVAEFVMPQETTFFKQCLRQVERILQPAYTQVSILPPVMIDAKNNKSMEIEGQVAVAVASSSPADMMTPRVLRGSTSTTSVVSKNGFACQWPRVSKPIFGGSRQCLYALINDLAVAEQISLKKTVTVVYRFTGDPEFKERQMVLPLTNAILKNNNLHRLAASERIRECQDLLAGSMAKEQETALRNDEFDDVTDYRKEDAAVNQFVVAPGGPKAFTKLTNDLSTEILELAVKYQVPSSLTSFIGVDDTQIEGSETVDNSKPVKHRVPLAAQQTVRAHQFPAACAAAAAAAPAGRAAASLPSAGAGACFFMSSSRSAGGAKSKSAAAPQRAVAAAAAAAAPSSDDDLEDYNEESDKSAAAPQRVAAVPSQDLDFLSASSIPSWKSSKSAAKKKSAVAYNDPFGSNQCAQLSSTLSNRQDADADDPFSSAYYLRSATASAPSPIQSYGRGGGRGGGGRGGSRGRNTSPVATKGSNSSVKSASAASTSSLPDMVGGMSKQGVINPPLDDLIRNQAASGAFSCSNGTNTDTYVSYLMQLLKIDTKAKLLAFIGKNDAALKVHALWFITYLCRLVLRERYSSQKSEWQMLDAKSNRFCNTYSKSQKAFALPQLLASVVPLPL